MMHTSATAKLLTTCLVMMPFLVGGSRPAMGAPLAVDDSPGGAGEWGLRPADGATSATTPAAFTWRPQAGATAYELQCARSADFATVAYECASIEYNCHCPPTPFEPGTWYWRFRYRDAKDIASPWSRTRSFTVPAEAVVLPMPSRAEAIGRIPATHPRLFVRPEQIRELRELADGRLRERAQAFRDTCDRLLAHPPPTDEPPMYPADVTRGSEEWRKIWWGNRAYTIRVLDGAATLAFGRLLFDNDAYGQAARALLLRAAEWNPKGSTGYRYNDEAGMPYAYHFSRTYTFVNDMLTDEEKAMCRAVMRTRGQEMYAHLCPRHLWKPYASHSNRAWHFLGEVGIAFLGEIPEAEQWAWFALNVFFCTYPVWSDDDGGWHEGVSYWSSYISRFTWWADVMRAAMDIDAYRKPYFSKIGYYPMYLQPPGTRGGGFGDLCAQRRADHNRELMAVLAAQARNPYWQWYVDAVGGPVRRDDYVNIVRGALPSVEATPPVDLPSSRVFRGTGQAMLNSDAMDAARNVQIMLKSSPFGTQSHGYESQNAFLLYAFGERLFIRTGRRDNYGSDHHKNWMWETKSVNSILVNGKGQRKHSADATGKIVDFHTSDWLDVVTGEAGDAYGKALERFSRTIVFVKPDLIVIIDRLAAPEQSAFEWLLHSPSEIVVNGSHDVRTVSGKAACRASFLAPADLQLSVTDRFDVPPRPRVKLTEWHLTAKTAAPMRTPQFVTVLRPHRSDAPPPSLPELRDAAGCRVVEADTGKGSAAVVLRTDTGGPVTYAGRTVDADVAVFALDAGDRVVRCWPAPNRGPSD